MDPEVPSVVLGDSHRLRQVLLNLISNSVKFTEKGSISVAVGIDSVNDDIAELAFTVADTGVGISKDAQEKLFSPYTQGSVEVARKYGGTGLGLAICRRLVELMGGDIGVESMVGAGTTFRFTVPLTIHQPSDAWEPESRTAVAPTVGEQAPSSRSLRILQVEDNATNRTVVEKIVTRAGHDVVSVENGLEALAAVEEGGYDIIIMDRHMPQMDGNEATVRIRKLDGIERSLPIIGLTAGATKAEIDFCLEAGMNVVLTKPLNSNELLAVLARLTSEKTARQRLNLCHQY